MFNSNFNLINLLYILIIWGVIILYLQKNEEFSTVSPAFNNNNNGNNLTTEPPFTNDAKYIPWGDSLDGCISRCRNTELTYDYNNCKRICEACDSEDRCKWLNIDKFVESKKSKKMSSNMHFKVQTIPGKDEALVKWTYKGNREPISVLKDNYYNFNYNESFILIDRENVEYKFSYEIHSDPEDNHITDYGYFKGVKSKSSSTTTTTPQEDPIFIYSLNSYLKKYDLEYSNKENINIKDQYSGVTTDWYIVDENNTPYKICNSPNHPMNNKWDTNIKSRFKKIKLFPKKVYKFVIQMVEDRNIENGAYIYIHRNNDPNTPLILNNKLFIKDITGLKSNTEYKLSIYPLFKIEDKPSEWFVGRSENENVSDIVTFVTNDHKEFYSNNSKLIMFQIINNTLNEDILKNIISEKIKQYSTDFKITINNDNNTEHFNQLSIFSNAIVRIKYNRHPDHLQHDNNTIKDSITEVISKECGGTCQIVSNLTTPSPTTPTTTTPIVAETWSRTSSNISIFNNKTITPTRTLNQREWAFGEKEVNSGMHIWNLEVTGGAAGRLYPMWNMYVGVAPPGSTPEFAGVLDQPRSRFLYLQNGSLYGGGMKGTDEQGVNSVNVGDILALHLDADTGSLMFYRNGTKFGTGFPTGVDFPVVLSVTMFYKGQSIKLL